MGHLKAALGVSRERLGTPRADSSPHFRDPANENGAPMQRWIDSQYESKKASAQVSLPSRKILRATSFCFGIVDALPLIILALSGSFQKLQIDLGLGFGDYSDTVHISCTAKPLSLCRRPRLLLRWRNWR